MESGKYRVVRVMNNDRAELVWYVSLALAFLFCAATPSFAQRPLSFQATLESIRLDGMSNRNRARRPGSPPTASAAGPGCGVASAKTLKSRSREARPGDSSGVFEYGPIVIG